ncbi:MAG: aldehyde ferredoxin oxidoreductase C-terminal domain-containing protein, partial [Chloroflexota bacterium]
VDLTHRRISTAEYDEALADRFLAGRGANCYQLYQAVPAGTGALDPENVLVMSCGLLTGTEAPASSRLHVGARSPLTGLLGSSNVGGHFGAELRAAGLQSLVIQGQADSPVYLRIAEDGVALLDAADLWGLDAWETQETLRRRAGDDHARTMAIGPGGEALVRYGCIMTERGHAAGRTGMGTVMGSKRLKAILVRGGGRQRQAGPEAREAVHRYAAAIRNAPRYPIYSRYSNTGYVSWADETGILATRNYQRNRFEKAAQIDGEQIIKYVTRSKSCHRCPVHCKAELKIDHGPFAGTEGERPDIEPIVALGSKCGVADVEAVLYLYNLCGRLGIDVISAASCLAFAMELTERGIVTRSDTDGLDLTWGNHRAMEAMLRKIARREGFGAVLAEGVAEAARLIGGGAEDYAYHAKGLELTAYDPRGAMGTALGYAVSNRGGDFTSVYALPEYRWEPEQGQEEFGTPLAVDRLSTEGKGLLVKRAMSVSAVLDSLGLCKVAALSVMGDFSLKAEAELASALSGRPLTPEGLLAVGERVLNLERLFNLRHGATTGDDRLPAHFLRDGLPDSPNQGQTVELEPMVQQFYAAMGWDAEGRPTPERLRQLGLDLQRFAERFGVPEIALPYVDRIVTPEEMILVLAASDGPLTAELAARALDLSSSEAAGLLDSAFRRAVLDRDEAEGHSTYTPTSFYTRMDYFATFDPSWVDLPLEARRAMDEWMLRRYVERVRPNVERLMRGEPAQGSPGNDSVVLLHEAEAIIDAATTIAVVPCDCRSIARNCGKPLETCIQFNAVAEKKLARGYGRRLTAQEAKELVAWADRKGLMHTTDLEFGDEGPSPLCNCCADDCYVFRAAANLGSKGAWPHSRYVATHNTEACTMCGACVKRCHFGAFHHDGTTVEVAGLQVKRVVFDPTLCWGCGLCTATCLRDAIALGAL